MMFLVPAVGVPSELMPQDTLKSAIVAFGTLGATLLFFRQQGERTDRLQNSRETLSHLLRSYSTQWQKCLHWG
jgi:hypothetical protein